MDEKVSMKVAAALLFIHGLIEVTGTLMMLALPSDVLAAAGFQEGQGKMVFMAALSTIWGLSRLVAGYATWSMKNEELFSAWH